jgi:hypothetical protein
VRCRGHEAAAVSFKLSGGLELTSLQTTVQVGIKSRKIRARRLLFTHMSIQLVVKCGRDLIVNSGCCETRELNREVKESSPIIVDGADLASRAERRNDLPREVKALFFNFF